MDEKVSIWGYRTRKTRYTGGEYDELIESPLAGKDSLDDIDRHPWPSKGTLDFSNVTNDAAAHAERAVIGVFTWGAYFIASFVRGMEDLFMDFALRKDYAHHLIDTIADRCLVFLDELLETSGDSIDIVYMADDYCSQLGPLFSPDMFSEFVMPYLTRFVSRVHQHNKKFLLHVCGAVRPLLPQIIEAGVDMMEPIQIRATGMEPEGLKSDFGNDLCFYGGLDLQQTLCKGSPSDVAAEVRRLIDILGNNGGYVFGPGHTYIQVDAPIENILTMYETALR
jgi:uroporphyrinogen decarboxylase